LSIVFWVGYAGVIKKELADRLDGRSAKNCVLNVDRDIHVYMQACVHFEGGSGKRGISVVKRITCHSEGCGFEFWL
jgi:hypothetical protein